MKIYTKTSVDAGEIKLSYNILGVGLIVIVVIVAIVGVEIAKKWQMV